MGSLLIQIVLLGQADTLSADTTGMGYRIGHAIGSWLPFLIIFVLALLVIIRQQRLSKGNE